MAENIETRPEVVAVQGEITTLERYAAGYVIKTDGQYTGSAQDLKRVKAAQRELEDVRTGITGPLNEALRKANAFFKAPADRLLAIERTIKAAIGAYADEQERKRVEEQRRQDEIARKERERLEAQRQAAEQKARDEQERLRKAADEAAAAGREAEAAKLAAKADKVEERAAEKSAALEDAAQTVVPAVVVREAPKVAGVSTREVWKFRIKDASLLPRQFLTEDEAKIRKYVDAMKADAAIPGVEIWKERQVAAGRA